MNRTDTSAMDRKLNRLISQNLTLLPTLVAHAHDLCRAEINKWLSGPHYTYMTRDQYEDFIGEVPIPRFTGQTHKSITTLRVTPTTIYIISKGDVSPWNIYVHEGVKYTTSKGSTVVIKPRPFMSQPITDLRPVIKADWKYIILTNTRRIGT